MDLTTLTITDVLAGLSAHTFSATELTQAFLGRIAALNSRYNIYLALNPRVLDDAALYDSGKIDPHLPLAGIPIAIKDNFLTTGMVTTASSKLLDNFYPPYDATVVAKLKQAGALILGKTNMDAWAHGSSTETSDFGPTRNPWDINRLPGGSSGGSAAAVAANLCTVAIGSETAGSIRQPAAWCGVTGFKPTYGRVSRYGVIAMASSTDSPGPLAKTITDAKLVTSVIAGHDPYDATSSPRSVSELSQTINVKHLKIGIATDYLLPSMRSEVTSLITAAARQFSQLGAQVSEISLLDPRFSIGVYTLVQRSEVSSNLARFDGIRFGHGRQAFGAEAKRRMMLGTFALSSGYYDQYYQKAQKVRTLVIQDFQKAFSQVDLIIGPTSPGPALPVGASQNSPMFGEMEDVLVEPSSIAGLSGVSIPCGFVDGLPIGLDIIGPQFGEAAVFAAATAYQAVTHWHDQPPQL